MSPESSSQIAASEDPTGGHAFWGDAAWLRVQDGIWSGVRHEVSGRASALNSLAAIASRGLDEDGWLETELASESGKLNALVGVLQAIPTTTARPDIGISLADVAAGLQPVLRLVQEHHDLELDLEVEPGTSAVRAGLGPLSAVLLVLASDAACATSSDRLLMTIQARSSGAALQIRSSSLEGRDSASDPTPLAPLSKRSEELAASLLSVWDIDLRRGPETGSWTLEFQGV